MEISRVTNINDDDLTFNVKEQNPQIGDLLHVFMTNPLNKGKSVDVVVYFKTNDKQTAISWVPLENTLDKHFDFMYT